MTAPVDAMLDIRNVTAGYGDTTVLRDVSLSVPPHTAVALLGPNGAGKTTLLRVASGLIKPTDGDVFFDGAKITRSDPATLAQHGMCHIPEGRGIFGSLTVRDNLRLSARGRDVSTSVDRAIEAFPRLGNRMKQVAGSLSGGEQQMLAISRAYVSNPKIVLVDEASMGLAPIVVDALFDFLGRIDIALLLVEQYVTRALALADVAYVMSNGRILATGPADSFDAQSIFEKYLSIDVQVDPIEPAGSV